VIRPRENTPDDGSDPPPDPDAGESPRRAVGHGARSAARVPVAVSVALSICLAGLIAVVGAAHGDGLEVAISDLGALTVVKSPSGAPSADAPERTLFTPVLDADLASTADGEIGSATSADGGETDADLMMIDGIAATDETPSPSLPPIPPPQDVDVPSVVARPVPGPTPEDTPPVVPPPPWAGTEWITPGGHVSTAVGCVPSGSTRPGAAELDAFFAARVGPVIGWDYQHVYPLGGDRHLWLFQDAFIDHSGGAATLGQAAFAHNVALVQEGGCFRLLHRGSVSRPEPFETGTGSRTLSTWFWPMGGETNHGRLQVFWVQMVKDVIDPSPPDGLGWHPAETWVATYDAVTLERLEFRRAANPGVSPVYGYAVESDDSHTYLFGNTFEQNLSREGGYWSGRHSATRVYLARVPLGRLSAAPEYRTSDGWAPDAAAAVPILDRHWAEFPLQPRFLDGQWVGVAAINGYWGDEFSVDVANAAWGPWTTVESRPILPRAGDPAMNTYHAHLVPWRDPVGHLVVTMSNNARDMRRDAWPNPHRYRPVAFTSPWVEAPSPPAPAPTASSTTSAPPTVGTTTPATTGTSTGTTGTNPTDPTVAATTSVTSTTTTSTTGASTSTTAPSTSTSTSTSTVAPSTLATDLSPPDTTAGAPESGG
jgi:hypothetical protein